MLELWMDAGDVAATRFARSRMVEVAASLQHRRAPGRVALAPEWSAAVERAPRGPQRRLLDALVSDRLWVPDFVTPFPSGPAPSLADELAAVAATPPQVVRDDVLRAHRGVPPPALERALRAPDRLLAVLVEALAAYWSAVMEPMWPRMVELYERDIAHRTRQLLDHGLGATLAGLGEGNARWCSGRLVVDVARGLDLVVEVGGRRLPLIPSVYARDLMANISPQLAPTLIYGVRGRGQRSAARSLEDPLIAVLGRARAAILRTLDLPRTTSELSRAVGITTPGVSQHLQALSRANLVRATRLGRRVVYARTAAADALVDAAAAEPPRGPPAAGAARPAPGGRCAEGAS